MADEVRRRRAGVLGSPIAHSRSPQLHLAAYRALGLRDWTYERIECRAGELAGIVSGLGAEWVGVSVTMPGKLEALEFATERTERAVVVGSANTLVRTASGWRADCTDVDGVTGALAELGVTDVSSKPAIVIGAGGTARPALVALAELGASEAVVVARDEQRAEGAVECGLRAGLSVTYAPFSDLARLCPDASAVISTIPADAMSGHLEAAATAPHVLDVIYHPWPTPLAAAVRERGGRVTGGLSMLLNQAYGQVEQFTGRPAPRAEMAQALGLSAL
ncbi:shikimate dehydrogenase [Hoyosella subflava]|uniref:shikimate dehydrogenase (NADP(+)) n=1 Tax=Hoyosella subflava (strain DSM 45089 / JCM 17490 / NBRC 109087 / DQS3-9A1) TaxID=443218 RepID=F6EMD3_HOYSD|nr:shikimate dehydrogenase [Hoyosella subflava]AEF40293.1 Shikimate-5-dehydrogenase [Hoyosella subflava DQS3-9A1]